MYVYDEFDRTLVAERVTEFRDQVASRSKRVLGQIDPTTAQRILHEGCAVC